MKQECLPALSRVTQSAPCSSKQTTVPAAQPRSLRGDEVFRLEKKSQARQIHVTGGVVWLTGTPASGDILLTVGETFHFKDQWPYVIQALEAAQVLIA